MPPPPYINKICFDNAIMKTSKYNNKKTRKNRRLLSPCYGGFSICNNLGTVRTSKACARLKFQITEKYIIHIK